MNKNNVCRKCKKSLPEGYKYHECEHCRAKKADVAKNAIKGAGIGVSAILGAAAIIATNGKFRKKS